MKWWVFHEEQLEAALQAWREAEAKRSDQVAAAHDVDQVRRFLLSPEAAPIYGGDT